jgi:hypothetical protein
MWLKAVLFEFLRVGVGVAPAVVGCVEAVLETVVANGRNGQAVSAVVFVGFRGTKFGAGKYLAGLAADNGVAGACSAIAEVVVLGVNPTQGIAGQGKFLLAGSGILDVICAAICVVVHDGLYYIVQLLLCETVEVVVYKDFGAERTGFIVAA